jgi:hypothetical protein
MSVFKPETNKCESYRQLDVFLVKGKTSVLELEAVSLCLLEKFKKKAQLTLGKGDLK